MFAEKRGTETPFFSICIPQFNRTSFLLIALKGLQSQSYKDFEICISDGGSTDGRENEIIQYLKDVGLNFVYYKQVDKCPYDKNLREAIALSRGKYLFLSGNDDEIKDTFIFEKLHTELMHQRDLGVVIPNYEDWKTGQKTWCIRPGGFIGGGVEVAIRHFRNLAFVSGLVLDGTLARSLATDQWDGSEMYQMYIASRIIASGKKLLELDECFIRKDIQILGETVDSYVSKISNKLCWFDSIQLPMFKIGHVVTDAVDPYVSQAQKGYVIEVIWKQLYSFTFPFWILEYRRVRSWKYSLCLARAIAPWKLVSENSLEKVRWMRLISTYLFFSTSALFVPQEFFSAIKKFLYQIAKSNARGFTKGSVALEN